MTRAPIIRTTDGLILNLAHARWWQRDGQWLRVLWHGEGVPIEYRVFARE